MTHSLKTTGKTYGRSSMEITHWRVFILLLECDYAVKFFAMVRQCLGKYLMS